MQRRTIFCRQALRAPETLLSFYLQDSIILAASISALFSLFTSLKKLQPAEASPAFRFSSPGINTNSSLDTVPKVVYYFYNPITFQTSVTCALIKQDCLSCFSNLSRSFSILNMSFKASTTAPSLALIKIQMV